MRLRTTIFTDVPTEIRRNRVSHATSDAPKAIITQLIPKLETLIVLETIQLQHAYWSPEKKYDFKHFME